MIYLWNVGVGGASSGLVKSLTPNHASRPLRVACGISFFHVTSLEPLSVNTRGLVYHPATISLGLYLDHIRTSAFATQCGRKLLPRRFKRWVPGPSAPI